MLLDFTQLVQKYNMKITGVIQAGAHFLEEYEVYKSLRVKKIVAIEPALKAFRILRDRFYHMEDVILFNHALGDFVGPAPMYIELANNGQSNSLLEPDLHLKQFPSIVFTEKEEVDVERLDNLQFDRSQYNTLVMDLQGYEKYALAGALETLKTIDYVYTEVNRDSVYKGNTFVWELDVMLFDFTRVETSWAGKTWGDALYIKKTLL